MEIKDDEFFKEATLIICSSLDIKTALHRVFKYLKNYVYINLLCLVIADKKHEAIRTIATAADISAMEEDLFLPISKNLWKWVQSIQQPFILTAASQDDNIREFAPLIKLEGNTAFCIPLSVEDEPVGFLILRAKGENENIFTPEHFRLLTAVSKPFAIALNNAINYETILKQRDNLIDDNYFLNREMLAQAGDQIIGANAGLCNVMEMVQQVARQKTTVLLMGETGTGKEVIANALHTSSPRRDGPFIKLNCGAIAEHLIDSELFGHEKGAFTGSVSVKRGRFERASGGTLFLDEIGELPLQSQVKLLRVLQSRVISRVGGEQTIPVDVRIIAATNRDLKQMVSDCRFREDLWFRLSIFPITIPPLRQRKEDIPVLFRYFMKQKSKELGIPEPPIIAPGMYDQLMNHAWPGNVRELENLVERVLIAHQGGPLRFDCLFLEQRCRQGPVPVAPPEPPDRFLNLNEAILRHITDAFKIANGKTYGPGGAAELLGLNPSTLRGRMRQLGIPRSLQDRMKYLGVTKRNGKGTD